MANRRFWPAIALILGIVVVGCVIEKEIEKLEGKEKIPDPKGKVSINGIPSKYNGEYVYLVGYTDDKDYLLGFIDVRYEGKGVDEIKLVTVSKGKAKVPMYIIDDKASSASGYIKAYDGDGVFNGQILIVSTEDDMDNNGYFMKYERLRAIEDHLAVYHIEDGEFSKGNLTVNWPDE